MSLCSPDNVPSDVLQPADLSAVEGNVSPPSVAIIPQLPSVYIEGPIGPIGPTGPTGPAGPRASDEKSICLVTTHHQIEKEDYVIIQSPIPRIVTLPAAVTGRQVVIKSLTTSGQHKVISSSSALINDHHSTYYLSSYASVHLLAFEGMWYTV